MSDIIHKMILEKLPGEVLYIHFQQGTSVEGEDTMKLFDHYRAILGKGKWYILVDIRNLSFADIYSRRSVMQPEISETIAAMAIVVGSGISKVLGNFMVGLNKPDFPLSLVNSVEDGFALLKKEQNKVEGVG